MLIEFFAIGVFFLGDDADFEAKIVLNSPVRRPHLVESVLHLFLDLFLAH